MVHLPTLKQLRYLCAVARTRHFGRAASECHVSQSTLSAAIQELEDTLSVSLIERSNKRVLLTSLGDAVVERSYAILTATEDLVALCESAQVPFSGQMRIGVIPTIAAFILPKLLTQLRKQHPQFRLFIREDLSARLISALRRGQLDVLLVALPYPAEGVNSMHLFYDEFVAAFPRQHPIAKVSPLSTAALKGQGLLLLEDGHCLREHALEACKLTNNDVAIPYQATSLNTIVQMVANGIGITLLPQMALDANILQGTKLETRRFNDDHVRRSIGLMWRNNSPRANEFQLLGEFIQRHVN